MYSRRLNVRLVFYCLNFFAVTSNWTCTPRSQFIQMSHLHLAGRSYCVSKGFFRYDRLNSVNVHLSFFNAAVCHQEYHQEIPTKNWDFPKAHSHQHMFRDIQMKGVTRNYNTKPSEKMNGLLKKFYRNHTNFKNVAPQVSVI